MLRSSSNRKPWRVRTQILVAVNVPLGIGLILLLAWDYHREVATAIDTKQANLASEAVAILQAVDHLLAEGDNQGTQSYINSVCHQMRSGGSHQHTIIVESPTSVFLSHGANERKQKLLSAIQSTPTRQVSIDGDLLLVGKSSQPGLTVYIVESLIATRHDVRRLVVGRLAALAALGLVAMLLVNFSVSQIVSCPVQKLVKAVDQIRVANYIEPEGTFSSREFTKLANALALMSKTLRDDEEQRRAQMEKAREIQQHLLPGEIIVPGLAVASWFEPAEQVAGDYYDATPLDDGSWLIALADVSGHGVPSALEAAILKVLLKQASMQTSDPAEILQIINCHFADTVPDGDFASMFLLRWIPNEGRIEYANAGHIPGLFQTPAGGVTEWKATGFLIGIDSNTTWEMQSISIRGNERLLLVSDGVIECQSPEGHQFGTKCLRQFFEETSLETPTTMIQRLQSAIASFTKGKPLIDDTTSLAIRFTTNKTER